MTDGNIVGRLECPFDLDDPDAPCKTTDPEGNDNRADVGRCPVMDYFENCDFGDILYGSVRSLQSPLQVDIKWTADGPELHTRESQA